MLIVFIAAIWVLFVILVCAALSGWLINILYALWVIGGALVDIGCQAWIDISSLWSRKVDLDQTEDFYHK